MDELGAVRKGPQPERLLYFTCPVCRRVSAAPTLEVLRIWIGIHDVARCLAREAGPRWGRARLMAAINQN